MNLSKAPRTIIMLAMFGVTITPHICNAYTTLLPITHAPEVMIPTQIQTFVEALVAKWAPACNLTEDEQHCVTLLADQDTCKTPMPLAPVRSALNKFCNSVKKASETVYGATAQDLEKVCDYCMLCVDWVNKAMNDREPFVRSCPCPDMMEFFGSSEPLFACLLLVKRLMIQEEFVVNGTACFNGLVVFCGGVSGLSGLSGLSGSQGPPGPEGAPGPAGATGSSVACLCWSGQLCPELPVLCTLSTGTVLFNATSTTDVHIAVFSNTNKDGIDSRCKLVGVQQGDLIRIYDANNKETYANIRIEQCDDSEPTSVGYSGINVGGNGIFSQTACLCLENFGPDQSPCLCWVVTDEQPAQGEINLHGQPVFRIPTTIEISHQTIDGTDASCFLACMCAGDQLRFCNSSNKADVELLMNPIPSQNSFGLRISERLTGIFPTGSLVCIQNFGPLPSSSGIALPCLCWNVITEDSTITELGQIIIDQDARVLINPITRDGVNAECFTVSIKQNDLMRFSFSCSGGTGTSIDTRVITEPSITNGSIDFQTNPPLSELGDCVCLYNFGPKPETLMQSPCLCWSGAFINPSTSPDEGEITWNGPGNAFVFNTQTKDTIDAACALLQLKDGDCARLTNINDPDGPTSCLNFVIAQVTPNAGSITVQYQGITPNPQGAAGCWCLQNFGQPCNNFGQVVAFNHEIITSVPCCNSGTSGPSGCSDLVGIVNAGGPEQAVLRGLGLNMVTPSGTLISLEQSQDPNDHSGVRLIRFGFPGTYEVTWNAHISSDSLAEEALPYPTPESSQRVLLGLQLTNADGIPISNDNQPLGALNMIPLADIVASNVGSRAENLQPVLQAPVTVGSSFLIDIFNPDNQALKFVGAKEGNDDPYTNVALVAQDPRGTFFEQSAQNVTACTGISTRNIAAFIATIKRIGNANMQPA